MRIHKEGTVTIIIALLFAGSLNFVFYWTLGQLIIIPAIISFLSLVFLFLIFWFFRNPKRISATAENEVVCPADGKVVVIEKVFESEFLNEKCIQVSVFMSPLNVHVNWYPINGKIPYYRYHPGKHLVAWHPKSSTENERSTVVIEDSNGRKILVRQIAGAVARRIVTYSKENQDACKNKQLGFIKFGSRVDIFLPLNTDIKVKLNDVVSGNIDVIALLNN